MKRIYLSGPMAGVEAHNFPAFDAAEKTIAQMGGAVAVSPANLSRKVCAEAALDVRTLSPEEAERMRAAFMAVDLSALCGCDAIYMLPGWKSSAGAKIEHALAEYLGLEVIACI